MARRSPIRHARKRRGLAHALALLCYLVGSLVATWPLAAHFTTHVTGDGIDDPALAWNLWWVKTRLVEQLKPDIFHSGWMFHPVDINLGFYTLTPLNGLLSLPLQSAASLIVANNLLLLSSFVLGGYGVWLLVQAIWARPLSRLDDRLAWAIAWLAGAFFAFAGAKLFYAGLGQFNIASSQWLPFCALYVWRTLHAHDRRAAWRDGALAGLFLTFQAWAELTYASFLLLFFALAYLFFTLAWLLFAPRRTANWWRSTQGMVAAALVFLAGIAPFLLAIVPDMRIEGDFFASGGGFADLYSADLMGYLVPTRLHPWLGAWVATLPFPNDKGQQIFLGYTLMILLATGLVAGLRMRRERLTTAFWLVAFGFFFLLTLGQTLRWAGQALPIPGPFDLVSRLPFFNGNRYPSRYSVILLLAAAVLATRGMIWLLEQRRQRSSGLYAAIALALIALLFCAEQISTPLPLSDFRIPAIYQRLAAEPGDFTLLELPTGWRNGARVLGKSDVLIMMQEWYQTAHGKRRLGGNTSRNPAYKFQYFSETPVLADLIALMNADRSHIAPVITADYPAIVEELRQEAPKLFDLLGIRFVTLEMEKSPPLLVKAVEEALPVTLVDEWQGADWTGAPSTIRLYAVDSYTPPLTQTIDLTSSAGQMYLAEGWSPQGIPNVGRYATRPSVDLLLPTFPRGAELTLSYAKPTHVRYSFEGQEVGLQETATQTITLPAQEQAISATGGLSAPPTRLTLSFETPPTPIADAVSTATPIGASGVALAPGHAILAQSAGEEVGDFAHLWIDGIDYANNERGYNLAALTPAGDVLAAATFDTMMPGESARMIAWLEQWNQGTIIAGAAADSVADEGGVNFDEPARAALQHLGVAADLRGKFRWSHAFVGVAGAPQGSAQEESGLIHPAAVWIGAPLSAAGYGPLRSVTVSELH